MSNIDVKAASWRLVEVGRVVLFMQGENAGRLASIIEIIDHKRVLVEGPAEDAKLAVPRHAISIADVSLTPIVVNNLPRAAGHATLVKKWKESGVEKQWNESTWAKTRAKKARRAQLTDFERFQALRLRKQERFEVRKAQATVKKAAA